MQIQAHNGLVISVNGETAYEIPEELFNKKSPLKRGAAMQGKVLSSMVEEDQDKSRDFEFDSQISFFILMSYHFI